MQLCVSRELIEVVVFFGCMISCATLRASKARQALLLGGSYVLYGLWGWQFAIVLPASTAINFLLGRWLKRRPTRIALSVGIFFNLALLAAFKYLPEISVSVPFSSLQKFSSIVLPLGLSFWTFQAMSYLFDLYREEELHPTLLEFALYMAFFPVVTAGPVCRMGEMLPQFRSRERTALSAIGQGFGRMATGLLMMQVAKLLGQGVWGGDGIVSGFDHTARWSGSDVWCLAIGYGFQLFFDFAGYSHIAIGAAQALGLTVPENFDRPFAATNPSTFWTRWHMSLSFWIRDYVFFPLAASRREVGWRNLVLMFSMVVFGAWHRASWLFVIWGAYQGGLLVLHRTWQSVQRRRNWNPGPGLWTPFSWAATMLSINFGWLFFRANSMAQMKHFVIRALSFKTYEEHHLSGSLYILIIAIGLGYLLVMLATHALDEAEGEKSGLALLARNRWYWVPTVYVLLLLAIWAATSAPGGGVGQLMYRNF